MNPPSSNSSLQLSGSAIDLGPALPIAAYHATERWHPERIGAMALYCSDGRWGEAFDEFCHRYLQIPRYDRLAVPGGPAWIAVPPEDPAQLRATRIQMDFLVRAHELERVVLITHFGCAWYGDRLQLPPGECLAAQADDVQAAAAVLRNWYPDLRVEAYLAMRNHDWLSFHQLDIGNRVGTD
jgi:Putative carbonic anhydrase